MLPDDHLALLLQETNDELVARTRTGAYREVRRRLQQSVGFFLLLEAFTPREIQELSAGRPLVAVDGSVNSLGISYPHILLLFQAYAKCSTGGGCLQSDILTPLLPKHLQRLGKDNSDNQQLAGAQKRILAAMELQVAMEAIKEYKPWLVLFDGGFMRFTRHAPKQWEEYRRLALAAGVLSVGVIEEAESHGLSRVLGLTGEGQVPVYDRELLFGVLAPGECFVTYPEREVKSEFCTVFARLSRQPQATAYDFLPEQASSREEVMRFLFTITPSGSRGIPVFIDIVDAEVRVSKREMELLVSAYLDAGLRERFFIPNRQRRSY